MGNKCYYLTMFQQQANNTLSPKEKGEKNSRRISLTWTTLAALKCQPLMRQTEGRGNHAKGIQD